MVTLAELANLKQLDKEKLTEIIKNSLYQAISKRLTLENELEIVADFETNKVYAKFKKIVTEQDMSLGEISLSEAQKYNPDAKIGDKIPVEMPISKFEPKVIKIARKVIMEKIRSLEEDRIIFDYERQKNQIISGKIRKIDYIGYIVDIGYADAILPLEEQVEGEFYKVGDIIRAFVLNIRKRKKDVVVILSRTRPEFVKKLFEIEIPEIANNDIEVIKIVREPGIRTKVAVRSLNKKVDPIASC
ncbi:MAG: transcription termination factor NusA, partial [Candidatus Cloacimonadota bacterium]